MGIVDAVRSRLVNDAGVAALVGARVYPVRLPQKAGDPSIVYQTISAPRIPAMVRDTGIVEARFQFKAWSERYGTAKAVVAAMLGTADAPGPLRHWSGVEAGTEVLYSEITNETDLFDDDNKEYAVTVDVMIKYRE